MVLQVSDGPFIHSGFFFFLPFPSSSLSRREGQWGTSRGHWELYHAVYRIGDVRPVQQVGLDVV